MLQNVYVVLYILYTHTHIELKFLCSFIIPENENQNYLPKLHYIIMYNMLHKTIFNKNEYENVNITINTN